MHKAKHKTKRPLPAVPAERILKLSESMFSLPGHLTPPGTAREWYVVACHWRNERNRLWNDLGHLRCHIAAAVKGRVLLGMGLKELERWLDQQTPDSTA